MIEETLFNVTVASPYATELQFLQDSIVSAYKTPLVMTAALLVLVSVLLAYHRPFARILWGSEDVRRWWGSVEAVELFVLRLCLWGIVTATMVVVGVLFLKFDVSAVYMP